MTAETRTADEARPPPKHPRDVEQHLDRLTIAVLSVISLVVLAFIVWARDRGFGLRDEGFYVLNYRWADRTTDLASQFHRVVDLVAGPLDLDVVGLRMLRLVILLVTATGLALALHRFVGSRIASILPGMPSRSACALFCVLAGLLGYAWLPQTIGYNDVGAALLYVEVALLLLVLADREPAKPTHLMCPVAIGVLASVHFFVKAPAAALVFVALAVTALLLLEIKKGLRSVALMFAGLFAGLLVLTDTVGVGLFRVDDLVSAAGIETGEKHNAWALARSYGVDLRDGLKDVVLEHPWRFVALAAIVVGVAIATRAGTTRRGRAIAATAAILGAVVVLAEVSTLDASYLELPDNFGLMLSLLIVFPTIALVFALLRGWRPRRPAHWWRDPIFVTLLLLTALPFLNAAGTNVNILLVAMTSGAVVGCALLLWIALATVSLPEVRAGAAARFVSLSVIGALFALQVVVGTVLRPYELPTNLFEASSLVEGVPTLGGLRLDTRSKRFFEDLREVIAANTDFEAGERVLALEGMPGVVFALDGSPAAISFSSSCESLRRVRDELAKTQLVVLNASEKLPPLERCLRDIWPGFPDQFEEVARLPMPYDPGGHIRVLTAS